MKQLKKIFINFKNKIKKENSRVLGSRMDLQVSHIGEIIRKLRISLKSLF